MEAWTTVSLPILAGTLVLSFVNIAKRFLMNSKAISPLQFLVHLYSGITIAFCLLYLTCWGFTLPDLLPGFWRAVFLGTLANIFIQFFAAKAASIDQGEVSLTAPLFAMTPGLITILAVTLGEYPSKIGVAGIFLMASGSYLLMFSKKPENWWEYFGPFMRLRLLTRLGHLTPEERGKTIVVTLALAGAAMGTFGLLFDGLYTRRGVNMQGLSLAMITLFGLLTLAYLAWYAFKPDANGSQRKHFGLNLYRQPKYLGSLTFMITAWVAMMFLFQPAYNYTYVAYVGTLKRFSVLTSVVMGFLIFKEAEFKKRLGAATLIVLGAILISMDDLPTRISAQMQIWGL